MEEDFNDASKKTAIRYGLWAMLSDVLQAAINSGQFTRALLALIAIVLLVRIPSEHLGNIVMNVLDGLRDRSILGYVLAGLIAIGWWIHFKLLEKEIKNFKSMHYD
jgi:hypothetical protein